MAATVFSFGFVFIHPFIDGNGHLIQHMLHRKSLSLKDK
ncbi:Fic family protein [Dyadobacter jiangsuensis]